MPPNAAAAAVTDVYRARMVVVRDTAADGVAGLLVQRLNLDGGPTALARSVLDFDARARVVVAGAAELAAVVSAAYVADYVRAGDLDSVGALRVETAIPEDLGAVRSALLYRLGRRDGRSAALTSATAVARRIARTVVGESAAVTVAHGIDLQPAVTDWNRVTSSQCCQRCADLAGRPQSAGTPFRLRHPGDRCSAEPILLGRAERLVRQAPTVVAP